MDIIKGIDGEYVVCGGKLIKIIKTVYSEHWFAAIGNQWLEYHLEDGQIVKITN